MRARYPGMRGAVFDTRPVFLRGLVHILTGEGVTVVREGDSPQAGPRWEADVAVAHCGTLLPRDAHAAVAQLSQACALVLIVPSRLEGATSSYLHAGARRVLSERAPVDAFVEAVRALSGKPAHAARRRLSDREKEVLRYISLGLTQHQVAGRMGLSPHTVDTYVRRIRSKLAVGNKAELTWAALTGFSV